MKKITKDQVERLYRFTREHYVVYYDVQTELVDHLANGIENQWQKDPEVPFEETLQKEFKKFGIYGFSDVVEKREWAMGKKYHKLIWKESLTLLKQPKIVVGLLLLLVLSHLFLGHDSGKYFFMTLLFMVFSFVLILVGRRAVKRRKAKEGKKIFLLETIIENAGGSFSLIYIPFQLLHFIDPAAGGFTNWIMSLLIVFFTFTSYVCFYYLPKKKEKILNKAYPEMKCS